MSATPLLTRPLNSQEPSSSPPICEPHALAIIEELIALEKGAEQNSYVASTTFRCTSCLIEQPIENFHLNRSKKRKHDSNCKSCRSQKDKLSRVGTVTDLKVTSANEPDPRYVGSKLVPLVIDVLKEIQNG